MVSFRGTVAQQAEQETKQLVRSTSEVFHFKTGKMGALDLAQRRFELIHDFPLIFVLKALYF
jgi:hypothetical protein